MTFNNFRDVQKLNQDKASMDMTPNEFKLFTSTSWNENYKRLTIGLTRDKYTGGYRLGSNSLFIPDSLLF